MSNSGTESTPDPIESTAFRSAPEVIRGVEPRIADAIGQEPADQRDSLKLIASRLRRGRDRQARHRPAVRIPALSDDRPRLS